MRWPEPEGATYLLDPCAGEGTAVATLRNLWTASFERPDDERPAWRRSPAIRVVACELEEERAGVLGETLGDRYHDCVFQADAFRLYGTMAAETGATVLYLNPPYDHDPEYGRLEHRFLLRFTRHLHPGAGFLFYLVPFHALAPSAEFLARQFLDLRAWRLPDPEFQAFRQVLVVGRRARRPLASSRFAETVLRWAHDPASMPVLPEQCLEPWTVETDPEPGFDLSYELEAHDLTASLQSFRPWEGAPVGVDVPVRDLLGARFRTAMPPKPAHIALALSSGVFNGHRLEPNDPRRHPPLLAKGSFERELVEVSQQVDSHGAVTGAIEIERPRLRLTILRLDDYSFHTLGPGTVPTGGEDPARWNAADLIASYDRSLAGLLARQFPALHDPKRPSDRIALPRLARTPFRAQGEAIQAALKLLAHGNNPFLVAEVGTGKSTMALAVAAALSPDHHGTTLAELRRVGQRASLPVVRRTLIVCPPHLLKGWTDQVAAVLPEARVEVLRTLADLGRPADFYLLTREAAKLGYAHDGVEGRCPRCGVQLETAASANASRRLRCQAVRRRAGNLPARLAERLATLLAPSLPVDGLVESLVRGVALLRKIGENLAPRPLPVGRLLDFHGTVLREVEALLAASRADPGHEPGARSTILIDLLPTLTAVLRAAPRTLPALRAFLPGPGDEAPGWGLAGWLRSVIETIEREWDETADGEISEDLRRARLRRALEALHGAGTWIESRPCGEPLYQAVPRPRRFPLAQQILRRHRRDFDLLVLDEAHEYNHGGSAQAKAAHRLSALPGVPTIVLTGSLMGGYASSLFTNFWALSREFREEFRRDEAGAFVARYGYRKVQVRYEEGCRGDRRGSHTDREIGTRTTIGEAPGVMPTFLLRHLLPTAVLVHKEDLEIDLPPVEELPVPVVADEDDPLDGELLAEYRRLEGELLRRIRADRFDPERSGRLLGALVELPSYLDRATEDLEPFEVRYPEDLDSEWIATGRSFPAGWRSPKERWLLEQLAMHLGRGEKVLVFLRHTGTGHLPGRLLRLLRELTPRAAWLDAKKVPTGKREAWIDEHVLGRGVQILLVNPGAVKTGLNNLVSFSVGLWYELDFSATTYRQANGRLHRIGQTRPVAIRIPYYAGTAQEIAFDLVAKKVSASLQVDGLDLQAALEAAGASEEQTASLATAMSLGQAVYQALTRGA